MSAKDVIHDSIKNALIKDNWAVTHDPLTIEYEEIRAFIDLGGEKIIGAQRGKERVAVEIKSFIGRSVLADIQKTLGQYMLYRSILNRTESDRHLYVGISHYIYQTVFQRKGIQMLMQDHHVDLLVVDIETEEAIEWIRN